MRMGGLTAERDLEPHMSRLTIHHAPSFRHGVDDGKTEAAVHPPRLHDSCTRRGCRLFDIYPRDVVIEVDDQDDPIILRHAAMANGIRDEFSRRQADRIKGLIRGHVAQPIGQEFSRFWPGGRVGSKGRSESRRGSRPFYELACAYVRLLTFLDVGGSKRRKVSPAVLMLSGVLLWGRSLGGEASPSVPIEGATMHDARRGHTGNLLLDALPASVREELLVDDQPRAIAAGDVWRSPGDAVKTVAFPLTGTLSLIAEQGQGEHRVEVATIGNEGAADVFSAIGSRVAPLLLLAQVTGEAYEVPIDRFLSAHADSAELRRLIRGYIEALVVQTSMSTLCQAAHHLNERCARWLLDTHDRVESDTFELKQEFLAMMLAVQRPSVSIAAGTLQASGVISYRRGTITIVDREGLENAACACYEEVRSAYSRLVPLTDTDEVR
jgi:CRP-like cAMP-binding protein